MKRRAAVFLLLMAAAVMTGCEEKEEEPWIPDRTAIQADKTGALTETLVDTFDKSYYSSSELESMIDSSIREYNADNGTDAITKVSYAVDNGKINLVLRYQSGQDVSRYNNEGFYCGSMLGAQVEGYLFDCNFRKVTDGVTSEQIIGYEEPLSHKEYQVLICNPIYTAQVPGNIVYVSENAVTTAPRMASARTGTVEIIGEENSDHLMYVIYEYDR